MKIFTKCFMALMAVMIMSSINVFSTVTSFQGFEIDADDWQANATAYSYGVVNRVSSGTNGIISSAGAYHAILNTDGSNSPFTRFDGYRSVWPINGWVASIDIYLDPNWADGSGFDYSVASSRLNGSHLRDFIWHVGVVTGSGLIVNASNNTDYEVNSYKLLNENSGNYHTITSSGWYKFEQVFRNNSGFLEVDFNLYNSNGDLVYSVSRSTSADIIATVVGGNRYGWFTFINVDGGIAVDNVSLELSPLPTPIADWRFDDCGDLGKDWVTTDPANATNYGAVGFVGHNNRSSMFEGNAYMDVGKPDKLNLTNNISLSTWIFAFSTGKDRQVFSKGNNKQITQYELKTNSSSQGILTFRTWNSGAKGVEAQNFRLADHLNEWIHVACTYEQTNSSNNKGTWKIYINGILNNTAENVTGPVETDRDVIIGAVRVNDDSPIQHWWDGLIDELKVYNITLSDEQIAAIFNTEQNGLSYGCNPDPDPPQYPSESSLVLWYDGLDIDGDDNYYNNPAPGTAVSDWDDKTDTEEDATMSLQARMPIYDNVGINGMPAVKFSTDYTNSGYANNDILTAPYNQEITTAEQDLWNPDAKDKDLYVVFGTSSVIDGIESENPSYYSDGRQCIFEAGGPMSGYNIYMADGKLVYGMWNRFEECFAMIPMEDLIQPNTVYLANLEYNAANKQFRAVLKDGNDPSNEYLSEIIEFSGLSRDMTNSVTANDRTAVGGAARTCYHDYNTGETYSDHFDGWIGEVQLYNKYLTPLEKNFVYPYLGMKFDEVWWPYPETGRPKQSGNWFVIKRNKADLDMVQLSTASPNPFDISTSFSLNLPETQKINVELFDVNGQKVMDIFSGSISAGIHDFTIDGANLTNGVYLFRVAGEKFSTEGKVVLNK